MYSIGIDLGGTNIAIGLCDGELNIVDKDSVPTNSHRGAEAIVEDMVTLTKTIIERNGLSLSDIDFVGIASPGSANSDTGVIEASFNIRMDHFPMAERFKSHLPVSKVLLANDANAAALGEALAGAGRGSKSCVMVTLGTGVGGGVILDGRIFAGGLNPFGAELGHMVIEHGGRPCTCGRRGCFEAYASATALINMTKEKIEELEKSGTPSLLVDIARAEGKVTGKTSFDAMKGGDVYGKEVVDTYINYLACGITNIVNIFQPEIITIGGGVCNQQEVLLEPLTKLVNEAQYTKNIDVKTKIVIATLKNDAGIIGAAALGR